MDSSRFINWKKMERKQRVFFSRFPDPWISVYSNQRFGKALKKEFIHIF